MKKYIQSFYLLPVIAMLFGSLIILIPPELNAQPGTISTYAGTGVYNYGGDGGPASLAKFRSIDHLAFDADGNLYISEYYNYRVRKIDKNTGIITTVAGTGYRGLGGLNGPATNAQLYEPYGVAFDAAGNMFIGEYGGSRLLKVDATTGIMTSIGLGPRGHGGDGGPVMYAQFNVITDILFDPDGNLYIAEAWQEKIRKIIAVDGIIDKTDTIITIAGIGSPAGYSGDGGPATSAELWHPSGLAMNDAGDLFITSIHNNCIRKIDATTGIITTFAGRGPALGDGGPATSAQLNMPHNMAFDQAGNLLIADYGQNRIRMIDPNGIISTIAGTGTQGHSGDGGAANMANISYPIGLAINNDGDFFFSENHINRFQPFHYVRKIEAFCTDPVPNFSTTSECNGNTTLFADLSTDVAPDATYEWDIDDDGIVDYTTVGNLTHTYPGPGSYTARLTISQGGCSANITQQVTVHDNPTVDAGANQTVNYGYPDLHSATANLNAVGSGGTAPYTYAWSPAANLDDPTSASPVATLGMTGESYTVTVTDANGCTSSDQVTVCVNNVVREFTWRFRGKTKHRYRVKVCHTTRFGFSITLLVRKFAVPHFLAQGAQLGSCSSVGTPCLDPAATPARLAENEYIPWEMKVYPNPFQEEARIEFYIPEDDVINIEAFDLSGQKVGIIFSGKVDENQVFKRIFNGSELPAGMYLIRLATSNEVYYEKVMLVK